MEGGEHATLRRLPSVEKVAAALDAPHALAVAAARDAIAAAREALLAGGEAGDVLADARARLAGASGRAMRTTSLSLGTGRCRSRIFHVVSAGGRAAAPPGPARGAGATGRCVVSAR